MAQKLPIEYVQYVTEGSSARKLELVVPLQKPVVAKPYVQPKPQKRKRIYVDPLAIFGVAVAICMSICILFGVYKLEKTKEDLRLMERYVSHLQQENAIWRDKYEDAYELEEIRRTALALGMVPAEEAGHNTIIVTMPAEEEEDTFLRNIGTFLTGLFA